MKIGIIGAGASGIMAAIQIKRANKNIQIDLFDINKSIGKKILASGNGRCNISNTNLSSKNYIGENKTFCQYALEKFSFKKFEEFCKSIGLLLDIKDTNKVYPLSNEAKSVVSLLQSQVNHLNINVIYETRIEKVSKENKKFYLKSKTKKFFNYDKVLISSGLSAAPQLNSTQDALIIAKTFGHTINLTYPSLVGLCMNSNYHHKLAGFKKEVKLTLLINTKIKDEKQGDLLFTKYGVSGFAVLDISQKASYYLSLKKHVSIDINFFPNLSKQELDKKIKILIHSNENEKLSTLLGGLISNKLPLVLLQECNLDLNIKAKYIYEEEINSIINKLLAWRVTIIDTQGFKHSEVSGGGIKTSEINNTTYESKKCQNLYFTGEAIDIVGYRGGYNLHFAWASGYTCAKAMA